MSYAVMKSGVFKSNATGNTRQLPEQVGFTHTVVWPEEI